MQDDKVLCTVEMDGEVTTSDDFVVVNGSKDGNATILYNTDAITLGIALKLISMAFVKAMNNLDEKTRDDVTNALGDAFVLPIQGGIDE